MELLSYCNFAISLASRNYISQCSITFFFISLTFNVVFTGSEEKEKVTKKGQWIERKRMK